MTAASSCNTSCLKLLTCGTVRLGVDAVFTRSFVTWSCSEASCGRFSRRHIMPMRYFSPIRNSALSASVVVAFLSTFEYLLSSLLIFFNSSAEMNGFPSSINGLFTGGRAKPGGKLTGSIFNSWTGPFGPFGSACPGIRMGAPPGPIPGFIPGIPIPGPGRMPGPLLGGA